MSSWQRRVRLLVGVFAVVFAVIVAFAIKRRDTAPPTPALLRTDPGAVVESTGGRVERFKLSHENVRVEYEKQLTYADGSTKMLGVTIITDDRNGRRFTVTGKEGHVGQNESTMVLDGDVRLSASDGLTVKAEHATYTDSDGMVRADGPVEFTRARMAGSGTGMTYDKGTDVLSILDRAVVHVAADGHGVGAADVRSGTASFARRDKTVRFVGDVKVERGGQLSESNTAVGYLSEDEKRIDRIELRENSRITAPKASVGGLQSLTGHDMNLKYRPDGETLEHALIVGEATIQLAGESGKAGRHITASTIDIALAADGSTPTAVVGQNAVQLTSPPDAMTPARTIRSNSMDAKGEAGRGLTAAQFAGNVQFRELGTDVDRAATAALLDVTMKPETGAIEEARFAHAVRFVDGKMTALAAAARYDLNKGTLALSGSEPGATVPHASNDRIAVDATQIDVTLVGPMLKATGRVKSVLQPPQKGSATDSTPAAKLPSMLKQNEPVNVTGNALDYDGGVSKATYTGAALLWQGDTSIKGESIIIDDRTGDMSAGGSVTTSTMLDDVDKDKQKQRVRSIGTAKAMQYEDAIRRATYTGDAHLSGPQGDMTADKIELYLKPSGDELERAEGYDNVTLRDQNRKTTGLRLTYTTADERYVVAGTPVTIVDQCGRETIGKTLTYLKTADTIVVDGNEQNRTQTKGNSQCP